jgi:hypothetical protein
MWCSEWGNSQDPGYEIRFWPPPIKRQAPSWIDADIDRTLQRILIEVYSALNNEMTILATIGIRAAFDRATELLNISPALSFKDKLDTLAREGMLSPSDRNSIAAVMDVGSTAVLVGGRSSDDGLLAVISMLEAFLYKEFVLKAGLAELVSFGPARRCT